LAEGLKDLAGWGQEIQAEGGKIVLPDWVAFRDRLDTPIENVISKFEEIAHSMTGFFLSAVSAMIKGRWRSFSSSSSFSTRSFSSSKWTN